MNSIFTGIDKFSLLDYDGYISSVLFVSGCNFRCPYCHNGQLVLNKNTPLTDEEIFSFLNKKRKLIDAIVISGGEPTIYKDKLINAIKKIRELGYKIKLDTNGSNPEIIEKILNNNLVDYIAMDIKNSLQKYNQTTMSTIEVDKISQSIELIKNSNIDYEFRTTLLKDHHTTKDIESIAETLNNSKKLFLQKYIERDGCITKDNLPVEKELAEKYKIILEKNIKSVSLRGY